MLELLSLYCLYNVVFNVAGIAPRQRCAFDSSSCQNEKCGAVRCLPVAVRYIMWAIVKLHPNTRSAGRIPWCEPHPTQEL